MKKTVVVLFILAAFVFGCDNNPNKESLIKRIASNKVKIIKLKQKNEQLQKQMAKFSNGNGRTAINVRTKKLVPETFEHTFMVNGSVEAVKESYISAETAGRIQEIYVKEGDRVKKGDLLVSLNSDVIKNNISEIKTNLLLAETVYLKRKGLWDKNIGSEIEFLSAKNKKEALKERLKAIQAQLATTQITSPIDGIVDRIARKKGELASPGQMLALVVNLMDIYINADLSERYLPVVKKGDEVIITFPSFPKISKKVQINNVGNIINKENRTFSIRIKMDNADEKLKPNLIAVIEIKDYVNKNAIVIPSIIIKKDLTGSYVYMVDGEKDKFFTKKIYVNEGVSFKNESVITFGLSFGMDVVIEGYNFVKDGSKINIK